MLLGSQVLHPKSFHQHLITRVHRKQRFKKALLAGLMLTSMVDMFALLVIFLLQSYSTSPEMLVPKGVLLPDAITGRDIKDAPVLALAQDGLYLDQKKVGTTQEVLKNPEFLMRRLADLRVQWQKAHPTETFPGEINLQADRAIPSTTVSQIMSMLPSEHYGTIQLAVLGGG